MRINKYTFCIDFNINGRSFDRDIEDIRLFLSEAYSGKELLYDRRTNEYYLTGSAAGSLENVEFSFLKRILIDSNILRKDEMAGMLANLYSVTMENRTQLKELRAELEAYLSPAHSKALLKMYNDLSLCIKNKSVIKIRHVKKDEDVVLKEIIPCSLRFSGKYMFLIAYICGAKNEHPTYFKINEIDSFEIIRSQSEEEIKTVSSFINIHSE